MGDVKTARRVIREMAASIVASYRPSSIILFGSYGYGEPAPDSDIDLLIVKDTDERPIDRRTRVRRIVREKID